MTKAAGDGIFRDDGDVIDATIGVVGCGFVGGATARFFQRRARAVVIYDPMIVGSTLDAVVDVADFIFVAVPTPMRADGSCDISIVEETCRLIAERAHAVGRLDQFIVVIKSTVPPGTTDSLREATNLRIVFSPEFLTERNADNDFANPSRIIVGGDGIDIDDVEDFFLDAFGLRDIMGMFFRMTAHEAELVKLASNAFLMTKVIFFNEIERLCDALGAEFNVVRAGVVADQRIGGSHSRVPGPDGHRGVGGHCFPKDMGDLIDVFARVGVAQRVLTAVRDRNLEVRDDRDWERMVGRAVVG